MPSLQPAPAIHSFPVEVLATIFRHVPRQKIDGSRPFGQLLAISQVCSQWRAAALAFTEFWDHLTILPRDILHIPTLKSILFRSARSTCHLTIDFSDWTHTSFLRANEVLHKSLVMMLRPHLNRAVHLAIYAPHTIFAFVASYMRMERFPQLTSVDFYVTPRPPFTYNNSKLLIPGRLIPELFVIPREHKKLRKVVLRGVTLMDVPIAPGASILMHGIVPPLATPEDDGIRSWFTHGPTTLCLDAMEVPPLLNYKPQPYASRPPSTLRHLKLSRLRATSTGEDADTEHSCHNFFDALYSPSLVSLTIDSWFLPSRVWYDFIHTSPLSPLDAAANAPRFPNVATLTIKAMHSLDISYGALGWFLEDFPRLRSLHMIACLEESWVKVLEVLRIDAAICPEVDRIWLNERGGYVLRDDPLPFGLEVAKKIKPRWMNRDA